MDSEFESVNLTTNISILFHKEWIDFVNNKSYNATLPTTLEGLWKQFIEYMNLGIICTENNNCYKVTNNNRWLLNKLKYDF